MFGCRILETVSSASVLKGTQAEGVTLLQCHVKTPHVRMGQLVRTRTTPMSATVPKVTLDTTARLRLMNVTQTLVKVVSKFYISKFISSNSMHTNLS